MVHPNKTHAVLQTLFHADELLRDPLTEETVIEICNDQVERSERNSPYAPVHETK